MAGESGARPRVLLLGIIEHADKAWSGIEEIADVVTPKSHDRAGFLEECKDGAFDGVVAAYRSFDSFSNTGKIDDELLAALPKSVKFLSHNGAGYDQIDVAACTKHGVRVSNTPTAVDDATADIGIFLMLGALRNVAPGIASLRRGEWRGAEGQLLALGHDPQGKVLGILGMGGIGRNFARKARVFGMRIRYYNRSRLPEEVERELDAEYVSFDKLLAESDVLSLNLPLNNHTRHTISTPQFAQMKRGVVIVNTARGAVMDEGALVEALAAGRVGSVGLDVYEHEPRVEPGLAANPRVLLVPHLGTWTVETQTKMEEWTIGNVRAAVLEGKLRSIVPEQKDME